MSIENELFQNVSWIKKSKDGASCSPNPNNSLPYTCYTSEALNKLKILWNARHPDDKIKTNSPREIWKSLKSKMSNVCDIETCWLKQKFIKENVDSNILNYTFAPQSPASWNDNPTEWLSTTDIMKVMKQYEKYFKCFSFLGPSPIDFDTQKAFGECVWDELCNFKLTDYIQDNKNKIGIIFNTDKHYNSGEHWVAMFINIKKKLIVYFDSYGDHNGRNPVPKEVMRLVHRIIRQGNQIGISFEFIYNKLRHQYSDSECGMYSIYFIVEMLNDTPLPSLLEQKISDVKVFTLRNHYFNKTNIKSNS